MTKASKFASLFFPVALLILFNIRQIAFGSLNNVYISSDEYFEMLGAQTAIFIGIAVFFRLILRSWNRAVHALCYIVIFWIFGGFLVRALFDREIIVIVAVIYLFLLLFGIIFYCHKRHQHKFKLIISIFALVVFSMQIKGLLSISLSGEPVAVFQEIEQAVKEMEPQKMPHVVYVIPDRYTNNTLLKDLYGFDNTAFTQALKDRNFFVWDNQYSNYPKTFLSIASTLNGNYVNNYIQSLGDNYTSQLPLYELIRYNQMFRVLRNLGYQYTNICSGWDPTSLNIYADENFYKNDFELTETKRKYLKTTPFHMLMYLRMDGTQCNAEDEKIELIKKAINKEQPQFIFWHSLITHEPYIFNSDGSCRSADEESFFRKDWPKRKKNYIEHINHFNTRFLKVFDMVSADSNRPVIFVIQADEGPYSYEYLNEDMLNPYNFMTASVEETRRKHGIINAIYLPGQNYNRFEEQLTPINNIRLIFSDIFQQELPLLDHEVYTFTYASAPYKLENITQKVLPRN